MAQIKQYCYVLAHTIIIILFIITSSTNAGIILDGTMGQSGELNDPDYIITRTMETLNGANLFHSFGEFSFASATNTING